MSEWISVNERLPEFFVDVLCYCESNETIGFEKGEKYCCVDRFCKWQDNHPSSFRASRFKFGKVLFWMPLPEPPRDE